MHTLFSLKVAQDPRQHFCQKRFQKILHSWFFGKEVLKKRISIFDPLYLTTETEYICFVNCASKL